MSSPVQRKLTTILAADAEGYSRMMEANEVLALGALRAARDVFARFIERHHGRIANTAGDGLIAEFPSVVEAVQCAIEVQHELGSHRGDPDGALNFRIGIHLGDVIVDGEDLLGEGVNLAARLQSMAEPGDVLISQQVYDQVHAKLAVGFDYVGDRRPKNYSRDVPVYRVASGAGARDAVAARYAAYASVPPPTQTAQDTRSGLYPRIRRRVRMFGIVSAALLLINLGSGAPFWSFWPILAMGVLLGFQSAPLFVRDWFSLRLARVTVVLVALTLINLATWSGNPWVLWPIGAVVAVASIRRRA
jgi:adenylate cyclase